MVRFLLLLCLVASGTFAEEDRIFDGRNAPGEELRNVVLVKGRDVPTCTGVIISPHHVLTAAHCLEGASSGQIRSHAGNEYYYSKVDIAPAFDYSTGENDVGIIHVIQEMSERPMPLLSVPVETDTVVMLAGFGRKDAAIENGKVAGKGDLPEKLQIGFASTLEKSRCRMFYQYPTVDGYCVGHFMSGPLPGDDGGPLIVKSKSGEPMSIGVAAFGHPASLDFAKHPCKLFGTALNYCETGFSDIYTRVSLYCKWIESVTDVKCVETEILKAPI